jgi:3-dehydroquinate dehydratase-1
MRPTIQRPLDVRGRQFGGADPLFCIPLVAGDAAELVAQAEIARDLSPDLVEWRADYSNDCTPAGLIDSARLLRKTLPDTAILFTLRIKAEGGAQEIAQPARQSAISAILRSGAVDILDLELSNEPEFLKALMPLARDQGVPVILAFHDFHCTPPSDCLLGKIAAMDESGADVAKLAVMPTTPEDVLRLLQVTREARTRFPGLPLAIMAMGALGSITRVAGFLYGSDMAFAVGKQASAPGQIPIRDARFLTEMLLRYSR